jgi:hypothetical protein
MGVRLFGIRHHGPGSARSLLKAFAADPPDCILLEGPAELESVVEWVSHAEMQPPVALLIYEPDNPRSSIIYPFGCFSPEWQVLRYARQNNVPIRFMDLAAAFLIEWRKEKVKQLLALADEAASGKEPGEDQPEKETTAPETTEPGQPRLMFGPDPIALLAEAAGFTDRERWWEYMVEHRRDAADVFDAIHEAVSAAREEMSPLMPLELEEDSLREACMRQNLRSAQKEGFQNIAVVCGAWHTPALANPGPAKKDADLLKGRPKCKVQATWVPWSYDRLCQQSGYSSGVESPGWYDHLWEMTERDAAPRDITIGWLTRSAMVLRQQNMDVSPAQVIDAVRLAEGTAALRGLPLPGLDEMNDATQAILCGGQTLPMDLLHKRLIVGEKLGSIPSSAPSVALQVDLQKTAKRLRLPQSQDSKTYDLDLRKQNDLERSHLLHRLQLLNVPWGSLQHATGKTRGTFHEIWQVQWSTDYGVAVVEASLWGTTVHDAATSRVRYQAARASSISELTTMVWSSLLADLAAAVPLVVRRLQALAAVASDAAQLMEALPPLAEVLRYGNVRNTDAAAVEQVLEGLVARISVGLGNACASLDDDAAMAMYGQLVSTNSALRMLANEAYLEQWNTALQKLAVQRGVHGIVSGRANRLLFDGGQITVDEAAMRLGFALSSVGDAEESAAWAEGFLRESGLLLVLDSKLLAVIDEWIVGMSDERFEVSLPLIRRTFSTFAFGERRQIAEKISQGHIPATTKPTCEPEEFDDEAADAAMNLLEKILG